MSFEWDPAKNRANQANHGISFEEAGSVFGDPRALSWADTDHSVGEYRSLTLGYTDRQRLVIVAHTDRDDRIRTFQHGLRPQWNEDFMSQDRCNENEIREQASAPGGVRGKYYERYMQGANVILLAPDVAEVFHDSETVNAALRAYLAEHGTVPR